MTSKGTNRSAVVAMFILLNLNTVLKNKNNNNDDDDGEDD